MTQHSADLVMMAVAETGHELTSAATSTSTSTSASINTSTSTNSSVNDSNSIINNNSDNGDSGEENHGGLWSWGLEESGVRDVQAGLAIAPLSGRGLGGMHRMRTGIGGGRVGGWVGTCRYVGV